VMVVLVMIVLVVILAVYSVCVRRGEQCSNLKVVGVRYDPQIKLWRLFCC
jgi:hypothetical protein